MAFYAAIDLHSSDSVLAAIDNDRKAVLQCPRPNDLPRLLAHLAPFQSELAGVAVESTYNWYWLVDGLMGHGYAVHLVNTAAIPQYDGLKHGNDHSNALHLAQLMRLGLLPEGYFYPREQRRTRDLLRTICSPASAQAVSVVSSYAPVACTTIRILMILQKPDQSAGTAVGVFAKRCAFDSPKIARFMPPYIHQCQLLS